MHNLRYIDAAISTHQNLLAQVTTEKIRQLVKTLPEAEVSNSARCGTCLSNSFQLSYHPRDPSWVAWLRSVLSVS